VSPETAAVISATASAVAALAAWAAVAHAVRWQRRAREPWLVISVSHFVGEGRIRVRIENTGGGAGQLASFWVREGRYVCASGVPSAGVLGPGERVQLRPEMLWGGSKYVEAVVIGRFGRWIHAWDAGSRHKKWLLNRAWRKLRPVSDEAIVHRFYPDAPPIDQLRPVTFELEPLT
jgi:hypothetical protein